MRPRSQWCNRSQRKGKYIFFLGEQSWRDVRAAHMSVNKAAEYKQSHSRPVQSCHLGQAIDDLRCLRPFEAQWPVLRTRVQISRGGLGDKVSEWLKTQLVSYSRASLIRTAGFIHSGIRLRSSTNLGKTVWIKHCSMEQLAESERLKHPASKPPRSIFQHVTLATPDKALLLEKVP